MQVIEGYTGAIPEDTKETCARLLTLQDNSLSQADFLIKEGSHSSESDELDHFTLVCLDSKKQWNEYHFPVKKYILGIK